MKAQIVKTVVKDGVTHVLIKNGQSLVWHTVTR